MAVLVNHENLSSVVETLTTRSRLALDTETTGLDPFYGDRVFSVIIADEVEEYYFNFNIGGFHKDEALPAIQTICNSRFVLDLHIHHQNTGNVMKTDTLQPRQDHRLPCNDDLVAWLHEWNGNECLKRSICLLLQTFPDTDVIFHLNCALMFSFSLLLFLYLGLNVFEL